MKPLFNNVLLESVGTDEETESGLLVIQRKLTGALKGRVIEVNNKTELKIGDIVYYNRSKGDIVTIDRKDFLLIDEDEVLAVEENELCFGTKL